MTKPVPEISVRELAAKKKRGEKYLLIDVREPDEYEIAQMGGTLIPLGELPERMGEIDRNLEIILHCHHGGRSARGAQFLMSQGFQRVWNLTGGINAWSEEIDPSVVRY